jgi:hypothetical protein
VRLRWVEVAKCAASATTTPTAATSASAATTSSTAARAATAHHSADERHDLICGIGALRQLTARARLIDSILHALTNLILAEVRETVRLANLSVDVDRLTALRRLFAA